MHTADKAKKLKCQEIKMINRMWLPANCKTMRYNC